MLLTLPRMIKILSLLMKYAGYQVENALAGVIAPIGPYIQRLSIGVGCILGSVVCVSFVLLFWFASFFLALAHHPEWAMPAFWTGLVAGVVGGLLIGIGTSFLKSPKSSSI